MEMIVNKSAPSASRIWEVTELLLCAGISIVQSASETIGGPKTSYLHLIVPIAEDVSHF